jgi:hypothetical protein
MFSFSEHPMPGQRFYPEPFRMLLKNKKVRFWKKLRDETRKNSFLEHVDPYFICSRFEKNFSLIDRTVFAI